MHFLFNGNLKVFNVVFSFLIFMFRVADSLLFDVFLLLTLVYFLNVLPLECQITMFAIFSPCAHFSNLTCKK